jgi:transcriptional regulator with XRE-family HTH domain
MATLDHAERRAAAALDLLLRLRGLHAEEFGDDVGLGRAAINHRLTGRTRIRPGEFELFAHALGVPAECFRMEQREILRWFADEGPDTSIRAYGCMHAYAGQGGCQDAA